MNEVIFLLYFSIQHSAFSIELSSSAVTQREHPQRSPQQVAWRKAEKPWRTRGLPSAHRRQVFCPMLPSTAMASRNPIVHDVFTAGEIARAAGASIGDADALLASGVITSRDGGLTETEEAVRAVLLLRGLQAGPAPERQLFSPLRGTGRRPGAPLTASGLLHAAFGIVLLTGPGRDKSGQGRARGQDTSAARVSGQAGPWRRWRRWRTASAVPGETRPLEGNEPAEESGACRTGRPPARLLSPRDRQGRSRKFAPSNGRSNRRRPWRSRTRFRPFWRPS